MAFYRLYMVTRPGPGPTLSFFWCYLHHLYWYPINIIKYYQWYLQHFFFFCIYILYGSFVSHWILPPAAIVAPHPGVHWTLPRESAPSRAVGGGADLPGKNGGLSLIKIKKKRGFYQENIWSLAIEKHLPWIRIVSPKDRDLRDINIEI